MTFCIMPIKHFQQKRVNSTVSAHAYSLRTDLCGTLIRNNLTVHKFEMSGGSTVTVSTRERPKLFFDKNVIHPTSNGV